MGILALTNFEITCKNETSAKKVLQELKKMRKEGDTHGNFQIQIIEQEDNVVYGTHDSNRIQNLEWQCGQIWERIKKIKGIIEANFPFWVEDNGCWFSIEDET